ncbi:Peptidase S24-like [Moraxella cuniculi DSM 21768]|uniref:Peptidase S24-like n=1 Tax=Moraxella cuniculi DSM 21768 TaxID=1122245 RepID=A0A1N7G6P3_9GAMM|nr:XRE family transcriptional regulator [Moraxella cuniculi]SIS08231.1 Peptidase S24-like [Moraxella cuniculi DSM 21768]
MTTKPVTHPEFGARLTQLMTNKKLEISDMADCTGITYEMIRRYREGIAKPRDKGMQKLADCLGVSVSYLSFGESVNDASNAELSNKAIAVWQEGDAIPDGMIAIGYLHDVCGSLGNGYLNEEPTDELQLWFREETLRECNVNPMHAKAFVARGDSMAPDITDGQTIAVDTSATRIFDGEIYAFRKSGELKVKYLFKHGDGFKAVSRNDDKVRYPDEIYTARDIEADNIEIIGQFWWKSETKRVRR